MTFITRLMTTFRQHRVSMRLARRDILRNKKSIALIVLAITVPTTMFYATAILLRSDRAFERDTRVDPRFQVANFMMSFGATPSVPNRAARLAAEIPAGSQWNIERRQSFCTARGPGGRQPLQIIETNTSSPIIRGQFTSVKSTSVKSTAATGSAMINTFVAKDLGVTLGSTIRLCGQTVTVTSIGVLKSRFATNELLINPPKPLTFADLGFDDTLWLSIPPTSMTGFEAALKRDPAMGTISTQSFADQRHQAIYDSRVNDDSRGLKIALIGGLAIVSSITTILFLVVGRRLRASANTLLIAGAPPKTVRAILHWEGSFCGALAGLLGCAFGGLLIFTLDRLGQLKQGLGREFQLDLPGRDAAWATALSIVAASLAARLSSKNVLTGGPTRSLNNLPRAWAGFAIGAAGIFFASIARTDKGELQVAAVVGAIVSALLMGWCLSSILVRTFRNTNTGFFTIRLSTRSLAAFPRQTIASIAGITTAIALLWGMLFLVAAAKNGDSYRSTGPIAVLDSECRNLRSFAGRQNRTCTISAEDLRQTGLPIQSIATAGTLTSTKTSAQIIVATPEIADALGLTEEQLKALEQNRSIPLAASGRITTDPSRLFPWITNEPAAEINVGDAQRFIVSPNAAGIDQFQTDAGKVLVIRMVKPFSKSDLQVVTDLYEDKTLTTIGGTLGLPAAPTTAPIALLQAIGAGSLGALVLFVIVLTLALREREDAEDRAVFISVGLAPSLQRHLVAVRALLLSVAAILVASAIAAVTYLSIRSRDAETATLLNENMPWGELAVSSLAIIVVAGVFFWTTARIGSNRLSDPA